ncbi:hypothetical protein D3C72_2274520 [compost metagenome]
MRSLPAAALSSVMKALSWIAFAPSMVIAPPASMATSLLPTRGAFKATVPWLRSLPATRRSMRAPLAMARVPVPESISMVARLGASIATP